MHDRNDETPDALLPGGDPAVFKEEDAQAERQQQWLKAHHREAVH
jgi:hypothetical protein